MVGTSWRFRTELCFVVPHEWDVVRGAKGVLLLRDTKRTGVSGFLLRQWVRSRNPPAPPGKRIDLVGMTDIWSGRRGEGRGVMDSWAR